MANTLASIRSKEPSSSRAKQSTMKRIRTALLYRRVSAAIAVLAMAIVMAGCTTGTNPVSGNTRAYAYSWEEEKQLGAQADEQIQAQYGVYDNEQLQEYVDRVGQRVLAESHMRRPDTDPKFRNTEFTFRVLDSEVVNAFALPGGYVYVTRGLMTHLNNEAQLAVVIGHEIGHVAARHASKQAAKQQLGQLGLIGVALGGEALGLPGGSILQAGSQAAQLLSLSYSRGNERESDELGVEYAALAGYEASEGAEFFRSLERIGEQRGGGIPTWQSTHPDPGEREEDIIEMAQEWRDREGVQMTTVDQEQYYDVIEGIVLGQNPRQGFVESNTFYHPDLRFQFPVPQGFQVVNQAAQVGMVNQDQSAQIVFRIAPDANSASEAASSLVQQVSGQQGVQVLDRGQGRASGGISAQYVLVEAQTQQGQTVRALLYFLEYGGNVYVFQGVTSAQNYSNYEDVFLQVMRGFAPLDNQRILGIEPTRLAIRSAQRSGPFSALVSNNLAGDFTVEELAILNQVQADEQIEEGRPLKLPR